MTAPANGTDPQATTPDWDKVRDEILCPHCDYNLRGLSLPRCPECGHAFEWEQLLESSRRHDSFFFEHHPQRMIRTFFQTLMAGFRPRKFWTSPHPPQRPRLRRLALYWVLANSTVLILLALVPIYGLWTEYWPYYLQHVNDRAWFNNPAAAPYPSDWQRARQTFGTYAAYEQNLRADLELVGSLIGMWGLDFLPLTLALTILLWPWLTLLALLASRRSMQLAQVRPVHLIRCVIYSGDFAFFAGTAALLILMTWIGPEWFPYKVGRSDGVLRPLVCTGLLWWLVFVYRLATACRRYLKLRWPLTPLLASQLVFATAALYEILVNLNELL